MRGIPHGAQDTAGGEALGLAGLVPGVTASGTTLSIDLGAQLKEKSGHDFAHLMETLELTTRRGFLDITFSLRVPEEKT